MTRLPIPPSYWERLTEFLVTGRYGRVEFDVIDGKVVHMRLVESVKPTKEDSETCEGVAA
jgi:hypothetical protein